MQAFQVKLKPSKRGMLLAAALHIYAFVLCFTAFYGWMRWLGVAALAASLVWAWRVQSLKGRQSVSAIHIDTSGRASLSQSDAVLRHASLSESSLIHRRGCFLQWQLEGKRISHAVLPDMTDAESYRRLIVWARFGRNKENKED